MSKSVFIIHNQDAHYLDTEDQWSVPSSEQPPFFSPHRDVAVNKLFEATLHDPSLRGKVISCPADERGKPLLSEASEPDAHAQQSAECHEDEAVKGTTIEAS